MPEFRVVRERGRYVLGEEDDGYGIWDVESGDDHPVERFPMTDEGFEQSWDRLRQLDRQDRQPLIRALTACIVAGVALWFIGSISSLYFVFGPFDDGPRLDLILGTLGTAGYRMAVGSLFVLAAVLILRKRPESDVGPSARPQIRRDTLDRVLEGVVVVGLTVWILSDIVAVTYQPMFPFPGPGGFEEPTMLQRIAQITHLIGFNVWVAAAIFLALRWLRRWSAPSEPRG